MKHQPKPDKVKIESQTKRRSHPGQGGMIAMGIILLVSLVVMGTSISSLQYQTAKRNVITKSSLQTYYIAKSGVEEAMATRMVPRSNFLNYVNALGKQKGGSTTPPYYLYSGGVFSDPNPKTGRTKMIGFYRYMIVGGNPSRDPAADGEIYTNANDLMTSLSQTGINEPFFIISKGSVCVAGDTIAVSKDYKNGVGVVLQTDSDDSDGVYVPTQRPTCAAGNTLDEVVVVAVVDASRTKPGMDKFDYIKDFRVFEGDESIVLGQKVYVPGVNGGVPVNSFKFDDAWKAQSPTKVARVLVHDAGDTDEGTAYSITSATQALPDIKSTDVIRVIFDRPVDHRTLLAKPGLKPEDCIGKTANKNNCAVRIVNASTGVTYQNLTVIPGLPGSVQLILFPPIEEGAGSMGVGVDYKLVIDQSISDAMNNQLDNTYQLTFRTK